MKKVVFVGPFPPPFGGIAYINSQIFTSDIQDYFKCYKLDINYHDAEKENTSQKKSVDIMRNIAIIFRVIRSIFFIRPEIFYIQISGDRSCYREFLLSFIIALLSKSKIVIHLHAIKKKKSETRFFPFNFDRSKKLNTFILNLGFSFTDKIIFLSNSIIDQFLEVFNDKNAQKCCVVGNFVSDEFLLEKKESEEKRLINILFMGRLSKVKGFFDLLEAIPLVLKMNQNFTFHICGASETEDDMQFIKKKVIELNVQDYIVFYGVVSGSKKREVFSKSDVLIHPSHEEIFPVTILEAMASGLCVVTTLVGVVQEVVEEDINGLYIKKNDPKSICNKLIMLANDEKLISSISRNNLSKVQEEYTLSVASRKIKTIFERLL